MVQSTAKGRARPLLARPLLARPLLAVGLLACGLFGGAASATVLADWDLDEITRRSDLIVIGVVSDRSYVVDEGKNAVLTESTVTIERTLMGKPEKSIVLTQLGGRAGSVVTEVVGDARLDEGDRVLLFTFGHEDGRRYLVGMALGAWFQRADGANEPLDSAFSQSIGSPVFDATGRLHPAPGLRSIDVEDVKAAVEKVAKAGSPALSRTLGQPLPPPPPTPPAPASSSTAAPVSEAPTGSED